jgi:ATP-dependent Clp protease ATP-binding subunit ClpX
MIKNGVLIQQDNKCFLCGKKGFKEIKDDVNVLDLPLKKIVLCDEHYRIFHVGNILGQFQLSNILLSFILNLDDDVTGEELREKLFEMVPGAKLQFQRVSPAESAQSKRLTPRDFFNNLSKTVVGQEEAKRRISITVFEHLRNIKIEKSTEKYNILLLGPSGSGKTLIINSVAKQLNVPFAAGDATGYSPTGFQGADVDAVIHDLFSKSGGDIDLIEQGVVFIDEIDKLASYHSQGTRTEALHTATQSSMLKLIEGKSVKLPQSLTGREGPPYTVDTNKILFCFGGAFNGLHEIVGKKLGYKGPKVSLKKDDGEVFEEQIKSFEIYQQASHEIMVESLIEYGLSTELVGRIQTIVALSPLKYEELKTCLLDLQSSPILNQALLFSESGYELIFTDEFVDETIKRVMKMGTGTRALGSMVKKAVSQAAFDLLGNFNESDDKVVIDSCCLDSPSKYLLDKGTCSSDL